MIGSPVFGYLQNPQVKTAPSMAPYQVTLEDRMRWVQIADVMANQYTMEPHARPPSAMYPTYPTLSGMNTMNTMSTLSVNGLQHMVPVPLPR
jgi:hypothetical protein